MSLKPVLVSPQRSQTFELTLSTAAAPAWVAARAAADPERMADRPTRRACPFCLCVRRVAEVLRFSLGMFEDGNPSALVNVCICVRFTRPSLGVQTPARGCELFFVPGVVCRSFFRSAADVFFGRAASVETCECRARLTEAGTAAGVLRGGPAAPSTSVLSVSRGICCAAPHG